MKRMLALLLAAVTVLACAACSNEPAVSTDDTTAPVETTTGAPEETTTVPVETTIPEPTLEVPNKKMDGFELRVYSNATSGNTIFAPAEEIGEKINDSFYLRNLNLQEKYAFKMTVQEEKSKNYLVGGAIRTNAAAGDNAYQLYLCYTTNALNYADGILPMNNIPYLNYKNPWWYPSASEAFNISGKQLALSGTIDICVPSRTYLVFFNKEIMTEVAPNEDLFKLVDDGKWTLDKYVELGKKAAKDVNGDGVMDENDRWAMNGVHWKQYYSCLINGFGINYVTTDKDGYPNTDFASNEKLIAVIQKLQNLHRTTPGLYRNTRTDNAAQSAGGGKFKEGGSLFSINSFADLQGSYRELPFEMGFIPLPKQDETQDRYYTFCAYGHVPVLCRALPKEEWENVGILMEALAYDTYKNILPVYKEETLKLKSASDPNSSRMIDLVWDCTWYDFGTLCWEGEMPNKILKDVIAADTDNIVSYLTSLSPSLKQKADSLRAAVEAME